MISHISGIVSRFAVKRIYATPEIYQTSLQLR